MTLVWRPGWNGLTEPEAVEYVAAVEAADGQDLEFGVARAINDFVLGCKNDGIWSAIKASCILAGARTLNGALVPLVGAAPTNFNFVAGDYNRETGLVGDGSTKYLDCNRNNNADPKDNQHFSVYCSEKDIVNSFPTAISTGTFGQNGWSAILQNRSVPRWQGASQTNFLQLNGDNENVPAFLGVSRNSSTSATFRGNGFTVTGGGSSTVATGAPWLVYASSTNARLAFYSIGEFLDLAALDSRVTDLITAIGAAIP